MDKSSKLDILASYEADWKQRAIDNDEAERKAARKTRLMARGKRLRKR